MVSGIRMAAIPTKSMLNSTPPPMTIPPSSRRGNPAPPDPAITSAANTTATATSPDSRLSGTS